MSMLLVWVGQNCYTIENRTIWRIIPLVALQIVYNVPHYIVGLVNINGNYIPVIDLCQLIEKRPAIAAYHSRIIIVTTEVTQKQMIGMIGEQITDTVHLNFTQFNRPADYFNLPPYITGIYTSPERVIQYLDIDQLIGYLSTDLKSIPLLETT